VLHPRKLDFVRALRRAPFTGFFVFAYSFTFIAILLFLPGGLVSAPGRYGFSIETLADHQYWRMFTALIVPRDPLRLVEQIAFSVVMVGVFEWSNGPVRAMALFILSDVTAKVLLVQLLLGPLGPTLSFGNPDILTTFDLGMSAGGMALLAATVHRYSSGWRIWAYLGSMGFLVAKILIWPQPLSDLMHLITFNLGFVLAPLFRSNTVAARS